MKEYTTLHLVKSEDLNHHGTLYAGRSTEWLVEASFIAAAAEHGRPQDVLCVNVHGFIFKNPVEKGDIFEITSRVVKLGKTSITVYVKGSSVINKAKCADGFITFVCVESDTKEKKPHGLSLDETSCPEELSERERALHL